VLGLVEVFSGWAGVFSERDVRALKLLAGLVIEALWSHEVHQQQQSALLPANQQWEAPLPASEALEADLDQILETVAAPSVFEPALSTPEIEDLLASLEVPVPEQTEIVPAPVEAPAAEAAAELPAPDFAALRSAERRPVGRTLAILALILIILATGTVLWRRGYLQKLLRRTPAPAASTTVPRNPEAVRPATAANPSPSSEPDLITPSEASGSVPAGGHSQLLSIRSWSKPEGTTIALFLEAPAKWEAGVLKDPDRVFSTWRTRS